MKNKLVILICIVMSLVISKVSAATTLDIDVDTTNTKIEVSGDFGKAGANGYVTMMIIPPDANAVVTTGEWTTTEDILYCLQTVSDNDGKYSFAELSVNYKSGMYTCIVKNSKLATTETDNFFMPSAQSMAKFRNAVNDKKSNDVYSMLEQELSTVDIGVDVDLYRILTETGKINLINKIFEFVPYANVDDIGEKINEFVPIYAVINASTGSEIMRVYNYDTDNLLKRYSTQIEGALNVFDFKSTKAGVDLFKLETAEILDVFNSVVGKADSIDKFEECIWMTLIHKDIEKKGGYNKVNEVLNYFKDGLTALDFAKYDEFDRRETIDKEIFEKSFVTTTELCNYIIKRMAEIEENTVVVKPSPGGSRGGSGGGGTSVGGNKEEFDNDDNVTFIPITESNPRPNIFNDMNGYDWAEAAIKALAEKGIISGDGDGKFRPSDEVTREEFVKMLVEAFNLEIIDENIAFSDVDTYEWYYKYVCTAYKNGLISGLDGNTFGIGMPISRQDAAVIINRILKENDTITADYTDKSDISDYAVSAVGNVNRLSIMSGYPDGSFKPKNGVTRAESAVIINRMNNLTN